MAMLMTVMDLRKTSHLLDEAFQIVECCCVESGFVEVCSGTEGALFWANTIGIGMRAAVGVE